jgi:hypothetical protein
MAVWPCNLCAIGSAAILFSTTAGRPVAPLVAALFCGAVWIGIRHLSPYEFGVLTRLFFTRPLRQFIDHQSRLEELERSLANAGDLEQCWETIQAGCRGFGFYGGKLSARGRVFEAGTLPAGVSQQWQLRVPLAETEYVNLYRDPEAENHAAVVGRLAGILRNGLQARFREWEAGAAPVRSLTAVAQ